MRNHLMVVVHAAYESQALRNAELALASGADGIFLINHAVDAKNLVSIYHAVRKRVGDGAFVGVNFLLDKSRPENSDPYKVLEYLDEVPTASAFWLDDVGYREDKESFSARTCFARKLQKRLESRNFRGLLFGGVAFKYCPPVMDPYIAARAVEPFVDVVTTSGEATGTAPSIEKIMVMRTAVQEKKLAVASGMTVENVEPFLPYVDYFLVNTGISRSETELDRLRVRLMSIKMRR